MHASWVDYVNCIGPAVHWLVVVLRSVVAP